MTGRTSEHPILHAYSDDELDILARKYNTDKHTGGHGFVIHYDFYFSKIRKSKLNILELGIYDGASVKMWEEYFPNANICGIDLSYKDIGRVYSDRINIINGNLDDPNFLPQFLSEQSNKFDIIIDDASHTAYQQRLNFDIGFAALNSGGIYVIEDIHTSYWEEFGGGYLKPGSIMEYLKTLADKPNYQAHKKNDLNGEYAYCSTSQEMEPDSLDKTIYSIHFYKSIVFIIKR